MNEQNIKDLQMINWLAKKDSRRKGFCYAVKDALLNAFGVHDGYDLQEFTRECWDWDYDGPTGEIWSWHWHILERVKIGEAVFHRPIDEYKYEDIRGAKKHSERFEEFKALCREKVDGIKEPPISFVKNDAVKALRRIVKQFFPVLRSARPKPARSKFSHFQTRYWSAKPDYFTGYKIRIPNNVVSCSGCGSRLTAWLDNSDFNLDEDTGDIGIFRQLFPRWLRVQCDATWQYLSDCPEFKKDYYRSNRDDKAWVWERELAAGYIQQIYPEFYSSEEAEPLRQYLAERAERAAALTEPVEV